MAFIYKITNQINGKSYIGKTIKTVEKRWKEHCREKDRKRCNSRPLYEAMNKYGVENFSVETLEECLDTDVVEKEKYWIDKFNTYLGEGYNATYGGDGKHYLDYDAIANYYLENNYTIIEVAKHFSCSIDSVSDILKNRNIQIKTGQEYQKEKFSKSVNQFTLDGIFIQSFSSLKEAGFFLQKDKNISTKVAGIGTHVREAANGKRQTAYGYKWKWNI